LDTAVIDIGSIWAVVVICVIGANFETTGRKYKTDSLEGSREHLSTRVCVSHYLKRFKLGQVRR
jgi:hypothetical protein